MYYWGGSSGFERPHFLVFSSYCPTFMGHLKSKIMRKQIILLLAVLLPLFAFDMNADEAELKKIPLQEIG